MKKILIILGLGLGLILYKSNMQSKPLAIGSAAPDFNLLDANKKAHMLSDYQGSWVILYFYPKDDTPGCTKEACQFRDHHLALSQLGAKVLGVSIDNAGSHQAFASKYQLPFTLLSDDNGAVAKSYGALRDLLLFKVAKRYTFLIDPKGVIAKQYFNVDPLHHVEEIVSDLNALGIHH